MAIRSYSVVFNLMTVKGKKIEQRGMAVSASSAASAISLARNYFLNLKDQNNKPVYDRATLINVTCMG